MKVLDNSEKRNYNECIPNIGIMLAMSIEHLLQQISDKLDVIAERLQPQQQQPSCAYTLHEWLEEWFIAYREPKLKDHGYDLRHNLDKHVKPHIENKPLNQYTAHDIAKALSLVESERMRQIVRQIYNQSFREAVRAGYIDHNPVTNVSGVSHKYENGRTLEREEEADFLQVVSNHPLAPLFRFYLLTGARPSEPLRVTWNDVSPTALRIRGTKTDGSDRSLPISAALRQLLDELPRTSDKLFPYTYSNVRYHFERLRQQLSFDMTIKDLRHTFGTRCLEAGVSMKTVQKWMGHSKFETTANIYSHITTEFEREEVEKLNRSETP